MNGRLFAIAALCLAGMGALNALSAGDALVSLLAAPATAAPSDEGESAAAAVEDAETAEDAEPAAEPAAQTAAAESCPSPTFADEIGASAEEFRVLSSLQSRRREIESMEAEAETRIQLAAAAEKRVEERIAELKEVESGVRALLGRLDEAEEQRLSGLVVMYEKMKAKDAARILAALEPETALLVATRMKESTLASVIGDMPTGDAKRLTEAMAEHARIQEPAETAGLAEAAGGEG